ncbi:response regulator [Fusibacter ferrireducens]|uniref:Stage 0 sporulation protein A homolog n=1 Tax=Fusibacter ferrireducens TaxID=2785058 RepID=A0ABR9ZVJ5_9FIRM|nr:response regulator [Fusibacter ferrireducens]MBF4693634.1 response regulator [Fusibacter ferrireducens]
MNYNFYLIDDDISVISILSKIIVNQNLGDVVGKDTTGENAVDEIVKLKPDIVIVDLLLPKIDGITLVSQLKPKFKDLPFIMISEVHAKDMVSKAYNSGIEFYINKPINVIEVINVVKRIDEKLKMKKVIDSFQSAFKSMQSLNEDQVMEISKIDRDPLSSAKEILSHLGVISDSGTKDILHIVEFILGFDDGIRKKVLDYRLSELYTYVSDKYEREKGEIVNEKTIEQRIRRTIGQALETIAEIGLDDYENMYFDRYANTLFEFREVRKEMEYLKRRSKEPGKINIKKFIAGLIIEMNK